MAKNTVYPFEVWDLVTDQMARSKRLGAVEAVKNTAHGREVGPATDVDASDVRTQIHGITVRN